MKLKLFPACARGLSAVGLSMLALTGSGCSDDGKDPTGGDLRPFRTDWVAEVDMEFPYLSADGVEQISSITIGGRESSDNFANRGDVIVNFDGPPNRIKIEVRRFTMAKNEAMAMENFAKLQLWAFTGSSLRPPSQLDAANDCTKGEAWQNDCEVRIYFDGLTQIARSGADLRVTLPANYRRTIRVVTEDNVADDDYHNRGNVCVENLAGTADIDVESALVFVTLADEITPMPQCESYAIENGEDPKAFIEECDQAVDAEGNPAPWNPMCTCMAQVGDFGRVRVTSQGSDATDITVDVPDGLWTRVIAENQGMMQMKAGEHCTATVTMNNYVVDDTIGGESGRDPWRNLGTANYPGMPAVNGAGYSLQVTSANCAPVSATESPEDFDPAAEDQESAERGNIQVCTDCIRARSCEELLPGI